MSKIKVIRNPAKEQLDELGVGDWPIWTKESSEFPWSYDEQETCYFLEGDVVVTPEGEAPVEVGQGDLVTYMPFETEFRINDGLLVDFRF